MLSITDYVDAVRSLSYDLADSFVPVSVSGDNPIFESGQNSVVFKLEDRKANKLKALKLFFSQKDTRDDTLNAISTYLSDLDQRHLVFFEYKDRFIYVDQGKDENENLFPGLLMDWAQGETLGTFLTDLVDRSDFTGLKRIVDGFKELSHFILSNEFAHGDLKHDNIIVDSNFVLKLIDYDGVFIPSFQGLRSEELGTPSFQHPKRLETDFKKGIDHFSILSIYISLLAIYIDPSLYSKYNNGQNLLFTKEDFSDLEHSAIYSELLLLPELRNLLKLLLISLNNDHIYIDGLDGYIDHKFPMPIIVLGQDEYRVARNKGQEIVFLCKDFYDIEIYQGGKQVPNSNFIINDDQVALKMSFNKNTSIRIVAKGLFGESESEIKVLTSDNLIFSNMRFSKSVVEKHSSISCSFEAKHYRSVSLRSKNDKTFKIEIPKGTRLFDFEPLNSDEYYLEFVDLINDVHIKGKKFITVCSPICIRSFNTDMHHTIEGIPVELSWEVDNAEKVFLVDDRQSKLDVSHLNSIIVSLIQSTSYELKCSNKKFQGTSHPVLINVKPNEYKLSLEKLTPNLDQLSPGKLVDVINLDDIFKIDLPDLCMENNLNLKVEIDKNMNVELIDKTKLKSIYQSLRMKITNLIKGKSE